MVAHCIARRLNWFDWNRATADAAGLARFHRHLISLRRARPELQRTEHVDEADVQWHGERPGEPDWTETSRLVAYTLTELEPPRRPTLMVAFNTAHVSKVSRGER
jgi:pullulanase/glycogen debranching enzyme